MTTLDAAAPELRWGGAGGATATRTVVSVFGVVAALAGIEHGVGALRQGAVAPSTVVIESWPDTASFEVVGGEPAMTLVPNLAVRACSPSWWRWRWRRGRSGSSSDGEPVPC
jgi:hypothetical protein